MRPPFVAATKRARLAAALAEGQPPRRRLAAVGEDGRSDQERYTALVGRLAAARALQSSGEGGGGPSDAARAALTNPAKASLPRSVDPARPVRIGLRRGAAASVTTVLRRTLPPEQAFFLERWKRRMVLELGREGFAALTEQTFQQGKLFHSALEMLLLAEERPIKEQEEPSSVSGYLASVQHVLRDISGVRALESTVQHEALHYQGLVDCVAEYRGILCVIDWKTSGKLKPFLRNTFDSPLQVAAYVGAINHDANYDFQVDCGLLVVAYKDGSPAHPHYMDSELCSQYWNKWLLRLKEFREKGKDDGAV